MRDGLCLQGKARQLEPLGSGHVRVLRARGKCLPLAIALSLSSVVRAPAAARAAPARDTVTFYGELTNQATDIPVTGNVDIFVRLFDSSNGGSSLFDECWDIAVQE